MSKGKRVDLSSLTGAGVRVAVVDSGISPVCGTVGELEGGVSLSLTEDGEIRQGVAVTDQLGHGTACAGIIRAHAPGVRLFSIRVFDEALTTSGQQLVAAIDWSIAHGMQVVNLSLGTTDPSMEPDLRRACLRALEAGVILVAAEHNDGIPAYPAALAEAIGVRAGRVQSRHGYYWQDNSPIECIARGDAQKVKWLNGRHIMIGGSSFAAPHVTAIVALLLEAEPGAGPAEMRALLRENATAIVDHSGSTVAMSSGRVRNVDSSPPGFSSAILFPFSKEMHAFLRFPDLTRFRMVGVADPVGRGMVGRDAGVALGLDPVGVPVVSSLQQVDTDCDGLVLGYLGQLGRLRQRDLLAECLAFALDRHLSVFCFESLEEERYSQARRAAREAGLSFHWPSVTAEYARGLLTGEVPAGGVDVPVVAVMGTSSSQGKFTLQLSLRRELLSRGYRVGQLGTEPHSELLGMDAAFPMGYASTVQVPAEVYPPYLDRVMRRICWTRRPDLIVTGAQSGTIPYDLHDHRTLTLPSLAFLMGVKPDAVVLVVNPIDPIEYIRDTIDAVRAVGKAEVVALAVSDRPKQMQERLGRSYAATAPLSRDEVGLEAGRLESAVGLRTAVIADPEDVAQLASLLIDRFSSGSGTEGEEGCLARTA